MPDHELRSAIAVEVHSRPFEMLSAPVTASMATLLSGEGTGDAEREHLQALLMTHGIEPPEGVNHFSADLGGFRIRWERHTEFSSWGFFVHEAFAEPFETSPLERVDAKWLSGLPGKVLTATHVAVTNSGRYETPEHAAPYFDGNTLAGSRVSGGAATVWTDFRIHDDGFGRFLVDGPALRSRQTGRLVQRLAEIETYRVASLLSLPLARRYGPELTRMGRAMTELTTRIAADADPEQDHRVLDELSQLAARIEEIGAGTGFRFAASRAYYELVRERLGNLREERIEGVQTFGEFMDRRLAPAMRTCVNTGRRIEALSTRVERAGGLLRARVNVGLERQNRDLLESMNRRASMQLRLQETVEGLSVVVLSYYLVGLVYYLLKGLKASGVGVDPELVTGFAVPLVAAAVYLSVKMLRRRAKKTKAKGDEVER